ncbi:diguanylate cyclase [Tautonia marina]|uniref:diguanylate cyclase n=1 Tax=Tautonia marina TaxID=2653855 RepID=UPI001260753A|nr:diguanylate cyclase [Tautonia marina]
MRATINTSTIMTQLPESSEPKPKPFRHRWAELLGLATRSSLVLPRFLEAVGASTQRDEVHTLLLRSAQALTGAPRVEIRPVGGPNRVLQSRSLFGQASESPLQFPIRYRSDLLGTLLVSPFQGRRIPSSVRTDLESLCAIAAIGDRLLGRERHLRLSIPADPGLVLHPNIFLLPHLRQLVLLARRRREPLGVLAIGLPDQLDESGSASQSIPDTASDRILHAVMGTLRESDLVVQHDERTLIAVLPNASTDNTTVIAETVARSILEVTDWDEFTRVAIGAACSPDDAREADVLLDVVMDALRRAREEGLGQIVIADRDAFIPRVVEEVRTSVAS